MVDSCWCLTENNKILYSNYPSSKKIGLKKLKDKQRKVKGIFIFKCVVIKAALGVLPKLQKIHYVIITCETILLSVSKSKCFLPKLE